MNLEFEVPDLSVFILHWVSVGQYSFTIRFQWFPFVSLDKPSAREAEVGVSEGVKWPHITNPAKKENGPTFDKTGVFPLVC